MEVLTMVGQLILGLSIIVTLHEFGHYLAARAFGIKVEKFFLFFDAWNFKLFSFKKGDTEYGVGWLPLGGYVKIAGMIDESLDMKQMESEPQPWEFRSKPAWQRLIVMVAGVAVNLILGVIIFSFILFSYGEEYIPAKAFKTNGLVALNLGKELDLQTGDKILSINGTPIEQFDGLADVYGEIALKENSELTILRNGEKKKIKIPEGFENKLLDFKSGGFIDFRRTFYVQKIIPNRNAAKAGIENGDKIILVAGDSIHYFDEFQDALQEHKGEEVSMTLLRDGETLKKEVLVDDDGTIGFQIGSDMKTAKHEYNIGQAFGAGYKKAFEALSQTIIGLRKIVTGKLDASKSLQGPISIARNIYGGIWRWERFWEITGLLSLIIGFMNILPIPALDGGHVLFLLIEMARRKPLSDKAMGIVQTIGVVILLTLMAFVLFNDIWQNFF